MAGWAAAHRIRYLEAGILAYPREIGSEHAVVVYSGPRTLFEQHEAIFTSLAGRTTYVGEAIGAASAVDCGVLAFYYGATTVLLYGAALAAAEDVDPRAFLQTARRWLPGLDLVAEMNERMILEQRYEGGEAPLTIHAAAGGYVRQAARAAGIDTSYVDHLLGHFERAVAAGHGGDELPALYEVFANRSAHDPGSRP